MSARYAKVTRWPARSRWSKRFQQPAAAPSPTYARGSARVAPTRGLPRCSTGGSPPCWPDLRTPGTRCGPPGRGHGPLMRLGAARAGWGARGEAGGRAGGGAGPARALRVGGAGWWARRLPADVLVRRVAGQPPVAARAEWVVVPGDGWLLGPRADEYVGWQPPS